MNERIQQLAEQAKLYDGWFCGKGNIEKFAELIVRECADIASMNQHQYESTGMYVLKHFGIEQ